MWVYVHLDMHAALPRMLPPRARLHPLLVPTPQVAGAVSSLFILLIILKLGELFRDLPKVSEPPPLPARLHGLS